MQQHDSSSRPAVLDAAELNEAMVHIQLVVQLAAGMITVAAAQAVLAEIERTETLTPIFDPTWYRAHMDHVSSHKCIVRAFVAFRQEIAAVLEAESSTAANKRHNG